MLKFKFEMNDVVKDYVMSCRKFQVKLLNIIMCVVFLVPPVILGVFNFNNLIVLIISIAIFASFLIFIIVLGRYNSPIHVFKESEPDEIIILEDIIEVAGNAKYCYKQKKLYEVKKVIDFGAFYSIIFYLPDIDRRFVCQKDLITKGTLEEFEKLFEDKIVRKTK